MATGIPKRTVLPPALLGLNFTCTGSVGTLSPSNGTCYLDPERGHLACLPFQMQPLEKVAEPREQGTSVTAFSLRNRIPRETQALGKGSPGQGCSKPSQLGLRFRMLAQLSLPARPRSPPFVCLTL